MVGFAAILRQSGIDFSFMPETFVGRNRPFYEVRLGGPISHFDNRLPDTMGKLSLFGVLEARVTDPVQPRRAVNDRHAR